MWEPGLAWGQDRLPFWGHHPGHHPARLAIVLAVILAILPQSCHHLSYIVKGAGKKRSLESPSESIMGATLTGVTPLHCSSSSFFTGYREPLGGVGRRRFFLGVAWRLECVISGGWIGLAIVVRLILAPCSPWLYLYIYIYIYILGNY